jgi:hypothetical protein
MKLFSFLRLLLAVFTFAGSAVATAAPTFIVSNGVLTEAKNVNVAGGLYDVTFGVGSCNQVFNGCLESAFAFHTSESAMLAARALLDQVFIDNPAGEFGSNPYSILGCHGYDLCTSHIPFGIRGPALDGTIFEFARGFHFYSHRLPDFVDGNVGTYTHVEFAGYDSNFAIFQLAAEQAVPEPVSLALFGLGLAGIAAMRRRIVEA